MKALSKESLDIQESITPEMSERMSQFYSSGEAGAELTGELARLHSLHTFLSCDCYQSNPGDPLIGIRRLSDSHYVLANLPGRTPHQSSCPFSYDPHSTHRAPSQSEGGTQEKIHALVNTDAGGFLSVDDKALSLFYPSLVRMSGMELIGCGYKGFESFEAVAQRLRDASRLNQTLVKSHIAKSLVFSWADCRDMLYSDSTAEQFVILIAPCTRWDNDEVELATQNPDDKPVVIRSGGISSSSVRSNGPHIAVTIFKKGEKGGYPLGTSIHSIYSNELPIPVYSDNQCKLLYSLIGDGGLVAWLKEKQSKNLDVRCFGFEISAPISGNKINPILLLVEGSRTAVVARPPRGQSSSYHELGTLIYCPALSTNPWKKSEQIDAIKKQILQFALNKRSDKSNSKN